jgi:hypothetical protein
MLRQRESNAAEYWRYAVSTDMTELADWPARNQARYREYNERIEPHNRVHNWVDPPMPDWTCECGRETCAEPVQLTVEEYEAVRSDPTHFLVAPSSEHVISSVERIVEKQDRYWVVEKLGEAGQISEDLDPRDGA